MLTSIQAPTRLPVIHAAVHLLKTVLYNMSAPQNTNGELENTDHHQQRNTDHHQQKNTDQHPVAELLPTTLPTLSHWLAAVIQHKPPPADNPQHAHDTASLQLALVDTLSSVFTLVSTHVQSLLSREHVPSPGGEHVGEDAASTIPAASIPVSTIAAYQAMHSPQAAVWRVALAQGAEGVLRGRVGVAQRTAALRMVEAAVGCLGASWLLEWVGGDDVGRW